MSEPSENALDDMWATWARAFAIAETLDHHGMTVSVIADDVPRDASAIYAARQTTATGFAIVGQAEDATPSVALQERRRKWMRAECHPFPDYR